MHFTKRNPILLPVMAAAAAGWLAFTASALPAQDTAPEGEDARKLIGVLQSGAPLFEKCKACQRLAVIGTAEAVPVLAGLLGDEKLAHYARFALEPIPDPSVDDALRAAMAALKGKLLVGVINSVGSRRDAKALDNLTKLVGDADLDAAAAAAAAIGRIGTSSAARALHQALSAAAQPLRPAVAEACLACAEHLLAEGRREEAVALYDGVRRADLPGHIQAAAMRGAIVAREAAGVALLVENLHGSEPISFAVALGVAREIPGPDVAQALVAQLSKLPPERQALVIGALAERGDRSALPAVLEAAKGGPAETRAAAIRALGRLGDASAVPVLLDAAAQAGDDVSSTALETLEDLGGKEVDAAIAGQLERGDSRLRAVLIELAGRRRIASAVPALRKALDEADEPVRLAAIKALGLTAGLDDLPVLISRLVTPKASGELAAVQEALRSAAKRLPDKNGFAGKVLEFQAGAQVEARTRLFEILSAVGGETALKAVSASARDPDDGLKAAALRVLGEWSSEDAAPEILELVRSSTSDTDRRSALASFRRVVGGLRFPKEARLALCQQAMAAARNDDERKLVLGTLAAIPAVETFALLTPHLANPALKEDAAAAAVTIGERILRYQPDAVRAVMKQVLEAAPRQELADRAKKLLQ